MTGAASDRAWLGSGCGTRARMTFFCSVLNVQLFGKLPRALASGILMTFVCMESVTGPRPTSSIHSSPVCDARLAHSGVPVQVVWPAFGFGAAGLQTDH